MKMTLNKYLYFITILLLNAFATIQANEFNDNLEVRAFENCTNELHDSLASSNDVDSNITSLNTSIKYSDPFLFCEVVEGDETEDSESSSKSLFCTNNSKISAFSTKELFENYSQSLQKNSYRPQSDINEPSLRLHLQFQVFII